MARVASSGGDCGERERSQRCGSPVRATPACGSTPPPGSILCDPWVNPAYFASWFPFPDNSQLDWETLGQTDYLYVSHLHRDHFDAEHLRRFVSKKATVLLPEYPTSELEDELRELGFTSVHQDRDATRWSSSTAASTS